jgi:hypothetical protein
VNQLQLSVSVLFVATFFLVLMILLLVPKDTLLILLQVVLSRVHILHGELPSSIKVGHRVNLNTHQLWFVNTQLLNESISVSHLLLSRPNGIASELQLALRTIKGRPVDTELLVLDVRGAEHVPVSDAVLLLGKPEDLHFKVWIK